LAPSAAAQVPVNPPYWEYVTSLDAARLQFGATSAGRELSVVGGYECTSTDLYTCDGAVTADVRSFDLGSREWTTRPSLHTAREDAGVAADAAGALYAIGGRKVTALKSVERLAPGASAWQTVAPMPEAVDPAAAVRGADG